MISAQLKEQTKQAHQSLEKVIIQQIKKIHSEEEYKNLLKLFYGFYQPMENHVDKFINNSNMPDYTERRKAENILHDIKEISGDTDLPICNDIPVIDSTAKALGVMYVLEGSTLGGSIIARMLNKQAAIPYQQLSFFMSYNDNSMAMWKEFTDAINKYAEENNDSDQIIISAKTTFEKFEKWAANFYNLQPLACLSL